MLNNNIHNDICFEDRAVFLDCKLYFHEHVDYLFSHKVPRPNMNYDLPFFFIR
jgi:hypothetical protein